MPNQNTLYICYSRNFLINKKTLLEMKKINKIILGLAVLLLLSSCADVTNIDNCIGYDTYGFWSGLWHGLITPISFFGSLCYDDIAIYAVDNNGGWYDFGFVLGIGGLFGGGGRYS